MADRVKADAMLGNLGSYVAELRDLAALSEATFLADSRAIGAARYYLQVSIQCCIDIAAHLVASGGLRSPTSYGDTFTVLAENHIVPDEFVSTLHQMTGLRTRLVHDYPRIDDRVIHTILGSELDDFDRFASRIAAWLEAHRDG